MPPLHLFFAVLVFMIWGFNFVVVKVGLEDIPPIFLGFARLFLTSIPAVFFIKKPQAPFKMILLYGLVMFGLQFGLLFVGMKLGVTPALASLLLQLQMFFTVIFGVLFFAEKVHMWQVLGALVSFSGIALVGMNLGSDVTLAGCLLVISAAISWAAGNIISKKIGKINMGSLVIWGSFVAWPPLLALSFLVEGSDKIVMAFERLTWVSGGSVLYITYMSTFIGYGTWSWLLHQHPLGTIAPFVLLVPVFGMLSAVLVLGEPLQSWKISAGVLVISGLCINLLGPRIFRRAIKI
ncbi:MAG: EamA family transporter [Chlamydiota bacterium]